MVCARCSGIYLGALLSSLLSLVYFKQIEWNLTPLIILSVPMLADVLLVSLSVYPYSRIFSSITGILFGSIVFIYILSVIENTLYKSDTGEE